jgi:NAD-dependent SIR2 family protein deacetylase
MATALEATGSASVPALADFVRRHPRLLVLTGAGCSTASGIPGYRDRDGAWSGRAPVQYREFVESTQARRRYWSRSLLGWPRVASAAPNAAHRALAALERTGVVRTVVTQNVDGLHQRAGSRRVVDLHGRLDEVECLDCGGRVSRHDVQQQLLAWNPAFARAISADVPARPDGDALWEADLSGFQVPHCPSCGGILKPAVVFFGENVPRSRVEEAMAAVQDCDALLVVGSSLMVFSGYRFCLAARDAGREVAAVNLGRTRADELLALKVEEDCGAALQALSSVVTRRRS